jgi:exonuclease SbcC
LERDSAALAVEAANQKLTGAQKELAEVQRRHAQLEAEIARAQGLDGELIPLAAALQKADADHARAAQALKGAENEWTQFESELKRQNQLQEKLQSRLAVVSPFEPFAGELAGWLERLQTERKAREKKERANGLLAAENEKLSQANGAIEAQASVLEKLTKQESEARSLLEAAQKRVPTSDPETLSAERRRTDALQTAFTALHAHLETRTDVVQQQQHCAENLSDLDAQLAVAKAKIEELSVRQIPSARTAALQARESLHLAEAASSEQAVVLRQALVAGRACPVCGATEHPKAAEEHSPATAALQALRNDAERKEKHQRDLEKAQAGEEARVQTFATQRQKLEGEAKAFQKRLETLAGYAPSEPEARVLLEIPEAQRASALERRQKEVAQLLSELAKREDSRNQAEKEVKAAQQKHQQKAEALQEAKDAHAAAIQQQSLAANNRQTAEANLANATAEHEEALGKLSQVLEALSNRGFQRDGRVGESGGMDYEQEPDAFQVWFEKGAKDWNAAAHDLEEANKAEGILLGKRSHLESSLEKARTELSNQQTAVEAARTVHASKKTERNGLLGGRSVVEVQTANTAAAKAATQAEKDAAGTLSEAVVKLKTKGGLLEEAESKVARQTTAKKAAADAVEQWLQVFGAREHYPLDRLELDGWLANDAGSLEAEEKQLEQTRSALSEARGGAQKIQRQLDLHLDSKPTEDDFETVETDRKRLLLDAQSAQDAVEACRAVVLRDDDLLARNSRLDGMLRDQEKILAPWEKLNDLIGSADGKKFRNMAQQWTLEILLKHANAQLVLLSGRYRLERLRDSLNLLVTDLEMDGRQRSVHSLSGGESFLVSLGLALGLASLTSSRLLIQSLFIDEGFGSLDTETLRIALNALSQLEAQGRKVGVISHVSEMVDAIPVQVRVVRGQRGASRVVV